jgi:NADH:ubiquinone reductase (H+-translocating)
VVIIGAGFAGLEVARGLRNSDVEITIIDKKNHHCFQPLLYQVATAALSPADIAWPVDFEVCKMATLYVSYKDSASARRHVGGLVVTILKLD